MTQTAHTATESARKIAEYIQCMDTQAIAAAARGDIDLLALFSAELASRGMGS